MLKYELVKRGDKGFVVAKPDGVVPVLLSKEVDDVREKGARVTLKGGGSVDAVAFYRSIELARFALSRELENSLANFQHALALVQAHADAFRESDDTIVDGQVYARASRETEAYVADYAAREAAFAAAEAAGTAVAAEPVADAAAAANGETVDAVTVETTPTLEEQLAENPQAAANKASWQQAIAPTSKRAQKRGKRGQAA